MTRDTPTLAHVPYNPFSPRAIRLCRGIVKCFDCDKPNMHSILQSGWGFQRCSLQKSGGDPAANTRQQFGRPDRWKGRCEGEWWSLALEPEAFGGWLAAVCKDDRVAAALIARCWPEHAAMPPPELWYTQLISGDEPAWIQIAVRPRERHLHRMTLIEDLLPLLLLRPEHIHWWRCGAFDVVRHTARVEEAGAP